MGEEARGLALAPGPHDFFQSILNDDRDILQFLANRAILLVYIAID